MQRSYSFRRANRASRTCLLAALIFCLTIVGCNNYCFVFVSNPGGSISTSSNTPSCQLNSATGTVRLRVAPSPTASVETAPTPIPASIEHIFVTLRGIEATTSAIPNDDSSNWRELAPQLATQPEQLDLLAHNSDSFDQNQNTFADVAIPADAYRQIRLRLSPPDQPATDEPAPQENACGRVGFNCVIIADGKIRPLVLDGLSSQFQIQSGQIAGGFFRVFPDTATNLKIEFNPQSSLFFPAGETIRMLPAFTAVPQASYESTTAPNP